ncbi:uncharacterized protein LOC113301900 [Papaver somniferum]|uniref:uncharacterized protein LOC113301900 n=1 Tax=Papaver somniferum TaxID=3469 RepID=UPI000E6F88D2|nr:uncharacterized protein LOC113301900 [Papaver somniferum]
MIHVLRDCGVVLYKFKSMTEVIDPLPLYLPPVFKPLDHYLELVKERFEPEEAVFQTFTDIHRKQMGGEISLLDFYQAICFLFHEHIDIVHEFQNYGVDFLQAQRGLQEINMKCRDHVRLGTGGTWEAINVQ